MVAREKPYFVRKGVARKETQFGFEDRQFYPACDILPFPDKFQPGLARSVSIIERYRIDVYIARAYIAYKYGFNGNQLL